MNPTNKNQTINLPQNMEAIKVFSPFFSFSFLFLMVTSEDSCSYSGCGDQDNVIQFPFTLQSDQNPRCGYPGFDLSCDVMNRTVLKLGSSGKFLVRLISYTTQEIQLYDQQNCLPQRLLTLNLTGSPFRGSYYQNYNFFNCSSNFTVNYLRPISCLSSMDHTIYAVPSMYRAGYMISNCDLFASVVVPTEWPNNIGDDLHLTWDSPDCAECVSRGGKCGFKNNKNDELKCSHLSSRGFSRAVKYVLAIAVGVPSLMIVTILACYVCGRFKFYSVATNQRHQLRHVESSSAVMPHPTLFVVGLDESVIQSYPQTVLGESRRLAKPDDSICPICLSEYRPKETLKTIPECKHCFHADCVDEWLRRNRTCPLCRNFPAPLPSPV